MIFSEGIDGLKDKRKKNLIQQAIYMSTERRMDKGYVVYTHNGILFSLRKEGKCATSYSMYET